MVIVLVIGLAPAAVLAEVDLTIDSPVVSVRADYYPAYRDPLLMSPESFFMQPDLLSISIHLSNFPASGGEMNDLYLVVKSADTGKTLYAYFDIMRFVAGGFNLSDAIILSENQVPFLAGLNLDSDIDVTIPISVRDIDLSLGRYYILSFMTSTGSGNISGAKSVDKITVYNIPDVCIMADQGGTSSGSVRPDIYCPPIPMTAR